MQARQYKTVRIDVALLFLLKLQYFRTIFIVCPSFVLGPSTWPQNFPICDDQRQSPIAIVSDEAVINYTLGQFPRRLFQNHPTTMTLVNTGHTCKYSADDCTTDSRMRNHILDWSTSTEKIVCLSFNHETIEPYFEDIQ